MSVGGIGGWIAAPTGGRSARSTPPRTLGSPCIISSPLGAVQARSASVGGLSACPELTTRPFATREPAPQARRELFLFFLSIPPGVNAGDCCSATDRVPEWQRSRQTGGASARGRARWIPSFRLSCEAGTQLSEEQRRGDDLNRAVLYITAAAVLIPLLNASAKYLAVTYPVLEVAWARYAGHFIYMLLFFLPQRGIRILACSRPALQLLRSTLLCISTVIFVTGLPYVPLATAAAISFTGPFIVTALAPLVLGERVGPKRWAAVAIGFVGALVVVRPGTAGMNTAALLFFGSALFSAMYQLLTRKLAAHDSAETSITYIALAGFVLTTIPRRRHHRLLHDLDRTRPSDRGGRRHPRQPAEARRSAGLARAGRRP